MSVLIIVCPLMFDVNTKASGTAQLIVSASVSSAVVSEVNLSMIAAV